MKYPGYSKEESDKFCESLRKAQKSDDNKRFNKLKKKGNKRK